MVSAQLLEKDRAKIPKKVPFFFTYGGILLYNVRIVQCSAQSNQWCKHVHLWRTEARSASPCSMQMRQSITSSTNLQTKIFTPDRKLRQTLRCPGQLQEGGAVLAGREEQDPREGKVEEW